MYRSLIIDDEKPVQIAISKLGRFACYGIEPPRYAVNGKDGLAAMREFHPDIVFVDMSMPVMDGCAFLEKAHEDVSCIIKIPIIAEGSPQSCRGNFPIIADPCLVFP